MLIAGLFLTVIVVGILGTLVTTIVTVAFYAVYAVGLIMVFKKMGEVPWKGLVPIYNKYISYRNTYNIKAFAIMAICTLVPMIFENEDTGTLLKIMFEFIAAIAMVFEALSVYHMCRSFGYGIKMAVLGVFCPAAMTLVLGFGPCRYIGNISNQNTLLGLDGTIGI